MKYISHLISSTAESRMNRHRDTDLNRRKLALLLAPVFAAPHLAFAELCWQSSGCKNLIGWVRVNKYVSGAIQGISTASTTLFGTPNLPAVNSVAVLHREAYFRRIIWSDPKNVAYHDKELKNGETQSLTPPYSSGDPDIDFMAPTTKLRILSYHEGLHLFVLTQVVSYPPNPRATTIKYFEAHRATYDHDQVI